MSDTWFNEEDIVRFSSRYKPVPPGYIVIRVDDHYIGTTVDGNTQSSIHWNKYMCRRWCFAHFKKSKLNDSEVTE